jgi:hypothetical protein
MTTPDQIQHRLCCLAPVDVPVFAEAALQGGEPGLHGPHVSAVSLLSQTVIYARTAPGSTQVCSNMRW